MIALLVALALVLGYPLAGGAVAAFMCRAYECDEDLPPAGLVAGFWPLVLAAWLLVEPARRTYLALARRLDRPKLPRARVIP